MASDTTSSPNPVPSGPLTVEERFLELAEPWHRDCAHLSSSSRRRHHPALQQIIALGPAVVPALIKHFHRAPRTWEQVLRAITGAAPSEGLETPAEWGAAWIGWARARDLPV